MEFDGSFSEEQIKAFSDGFNSAVGELEEVINNLIVDIRAETTLEKAAYLSLYTPMIDQLWSVSLLTGPAKSMFEGVLYRNNPKSLSVYDPEIDFYSGDRISGGNRQLFSWDSQE